MKAGTFSGNTSCIFLNTSYTICSAPEMGGTTSPSWVSIPGISGGMKSVSMVKMMLAWTKGMAGSWLFGWWVLAVTACRNDPDGSSYQCVANWAKDVKHCFVIWRLSV